MINGSALELMDTSIVHPYGVLSYGVKSNAEKWSSNRYGVPAAYLTLCATTYVRLLSTTYYTY